MCSDETSILTVSPAGGNTIHACKGTIKSASCPAGIPAIYLLVPFPVRDSPTLTHTSLSG